MKYNREALGAMDDVEHATGGHVTNDDLIAPKKSMTMYEIAETVVRQFPPGTFLEGVAGEAVMAGLTAGGTVQDAIKAMVVVFDRYRIPPGVDYATEGYIGA